MKILVDPALYKVKEDLYIQVRSAEGRVITNEELRVLPYSTGPYAQEWIFRQQSLQRLVKHLQKKGRSLNILDVGCGNGWMSHQLYQHGHHVTGIDLNMVELQQAEETFGQSERLQWIYGNVFEAGLEKQGFDIILFAASCQYFADIAVLTSSLLPLLKESGNIHFFDSAFYSAKDLSAAKKRTEDYYTQLGFPQMKEYYFHHSIESLKQIGYKKVYPPFWKKPLLQWWMKGRE